MDSRGKFLTVETKIYLFLERVRVKYTHSTTQKRVSFKYVETQY